MTYDAMAIIRSIMDGSAKGEPPPFSTHLGLDKTLITVRAEVGEIDMDWHIAPQLCLRDGFVQGGMINVVADIGQSFAFWSTSVEPESYSTTDFHTRFIRPIMAGSTIRLENRVINRSRRTGTIETRFVDLATGKFHALVSGGWVLASRAL
jgi:acyl-coenzyme A thioesterase PaaI-like protein